MVKKKEATPFSAKTTTTKKAESKKPVIERETLGASASRKTKAKKKDTAPKATPVPAAEATVASKSAEPVRIDKAAAEKPAAAALSRIMAYVDIGPGNTLFVRGEGGGLNWEAGVAMECIAGDCWSWSARSGQDITFKLLINDQRWSAGDNLTVANGDTAAFMPAF
jgi:hypothetical protein